MDMPRRCCYIISEQMQDKGIIQNALTYSRSLKACADSGTPDEGQCINVEIVKKRLEYEILIGNTLLSMYVTYGSLQTAEDVFYYLNFDTNGAYFFKQTLSRIFHNKKKMLKLMKSIHCI